MCVRVCVYIIRDEDRALTDYAGSVQAYRGRAVDATQRRLLNVGGRRSTGRLGNATRKKTACSAAERFLRRVRTSINNCKIRNDRKRFCLGGAESIFFCQYRRRRTTSCLSLSLA